MGIWNAHKLCGMVATFSTAAGKVAAELEDHAAQGHLEAARPLVEQLETMIRQLVKMVGHLSLESLQRQAQVDESSRLIASS